MKKNKIWFKPIALAGLASCVYVFMEWVFFATKPSFMSSMNPVQKMMVFFVSGFVFTLAAIVSAGLTVIISKFLKSLRWFSAIVPSLIFTLLSLILLDNFTYTVFKFGIVTSQDIWRGLYAVGFLAAFVLFLRKTSIYLQRRPDRGAVLAGYFVLFLFSISTVNFVTRIPHFHFTTSRNGPLEGTSSELPNIILLGWDGVNATHMSVYGYERDTTPNLSELARNALVAENGLVIQRISERVQHIFFIKKMENPYQAVTEPVYATHDDQRLKAMIDYFDGANGPLFLHVHMMDTHGPIFYVPNQHFSAGQTQDKEWTTNFYDDSILNSDRYIHELFGYLSESGKIKNTIVILYSDHGLQWNPLERVPLIFWFPNGQYAGTIRDNIQLIDIAPTILSYLRVPQPAWMQGQSILVADLSRARPILSANVVDELMITEDRRTWILDESKISAPFYQLGKINMVVCNKWFSLDLESPELSYGAVDGSTASCPDDVIPSPEQAKEILLQHLFNEHYDVAKFPVGIPVTGVH